MCCICGGGRNGTVPEPVVIPPISQTALDEWLQSQEPTNFTSTIPDDCNLDIKTVYYENPDYQDAKILFAASTCETKTVRVTLWISQTDADLYIETS